MGEAERRKRISDIDLDKRECEIIIFEVIEEIVRRIKFLESKKSQ